MVNIATSCGATLLGESVKLWLEVTRLSVSKIIFSIAREPCMGFQREIPGMYRDREGQFVVLC